MQADTRDDVQQHMQWQRRAWGGVSAGFVSGLVTPVVHSYTSTHPSLCAWAVLRLLWRAGQHDVGVVGSYNKNVRVNHSMPRLLWRTIARFERYTRKPDLNAGTQARVRTNAHEQRNNHAHAHARRRALARGTPHMAIEKRHTRPYDLRFSIAVWFAGSGLARSCGKTTGTCASTCVWDEDEREG